MKWLSMAMRPDSGSRRLGSRSVRRSRPNLEQVEGRQLLSTMATNYNGITGVAGGSVWHFQNNGGWSNLGGVGVTSVVDSRDQFGGDEIFVKLNTNALWSYDLATNQWRNTGGQADSMIAASNGIEVINGGNLWHYQDNGGWSKLGGIGVTSVIDTHNQKQQEEFFVQLNTGAVWSYTVVTGQWQNTGGAVQSLVGSRVGINALAGGSLFHYDDNGGWSGVGGIAINSIVDTRNILGQDEVFARLGDSSIWSYTFATGQWQNTGGRLDNMIANADGISGTNLGSLAFLWHYQDDGGWVNTGGGHVTSLIDSYDQYGQEEMFARLSDHSVWYYAFATKTWNSASGSLD